MPRQRIWQKLEIGRIGKPNGPITCRGSISVLYRTIYLLYKKNDAACHALGNLNLVAGFPDQIGNIDHRQWIGAVDFEEVARCDRLQRFARFQRRQRAFETGKIEFYSRHVPNHDEAEAQRQLSISSESAARKRLHQTFIGQEPDRLAGLDLRDFFAKLDQAIS